jgi:hypothetical protein
MNRTSLNGVSIFRAAHLPAPQLLIGSRALEHVARRHRKHPNRPLVFDIIPAGPGPDA